METAGDDSSETPQAQCKTKSGSFRLRSPSLNSVRLRRIFDMFDRNNDGLISVDELSQPLNLLGLDTDLSELDSMIRSFIKEGNAGLEFDDFQALHRSLGDVFFGCDAGEDFEAAAAEEEKKEQEEAEMKEAFKVFDEDGDGFISARELQVVLVKLGLLEKGGNQIDRVEQMISSVDKNRDGRVDFSEFKDMMRCVMVRNG